VECLILFAKTPTLHQVKTRLASELTPPVTLGLHEAMLEDQIRFVRSLESEARQGELCIGETGQGEGDLGTRMHRAFVRAFADGCAAAAIIGSDAPSLPRAFVEEAFAQLAGGADAAIVPAEDGGYVLVGVSRPVELLFAGVPWGTPSVLATTRRIAREAGLQLAETAPWPDVDVAADLPRLAADLNADPSRAPATLAFLRKLGL